jgi:hypothetical protein
LAQRNKRRQRQGSGHTGRRRPGHITPGEHPANRKADDNDDDGPADHRDQRDDQGMQTPAGGAAQKVGDAVGSGGQQRENDRHGPGT